MSAAEPIAELPEIPASTWREFAPHLAALWFPLVSTAFLASGPHPWWAALLFFIPLDLTFRLDRRAGPELRQPARDLPAWPFDALVYLLAAIQLLNIGLVGWMYSQQSLFSADLLMAFVVVGASSGFSIITAHELIHRNRRWEVLLGRLLLCTVLYEHFYTEHLRGHHVRVGTSEDPATARFGESFIAFYKRTVPAQFRSAWRLESRRLGDAEMSLLDPRMLGHRVVHGLLVQAGLAAGMALLAGPVALAAFVIQGLSASRLLEVVNYFEHWGLERRGPTARPRDSWDTHAWFTYYGLVGLSRHADHHAHASRPYQELRVCEEPPILPGGYVHTIVMVFVRNDEFIRRATEELRRKRLGPFATDSEPSASPTPDAA